MYQTPEQVSPLADLIASILGAVFSWKMLLFILLIWALSSSFYIVKGKTAAILETFGKPHKKATLSGLHFKWPSPITQIVKRVNLQQREIADDISVKTKDNAFLKLPTKVLFMASSDREGAVKSHYELHEAEKQIKDYVFNCVRQTASGMDMEQLYTNREELKKQVDEALKAQFEHFGFVIANVLVDQPQPSKEVEDAFNKVIASKRLKEAAQNEADAAQVKLVGVAKAESQSKELQGQGIAKMRNAIAEGLAEAMKKIEAAGISPEETIAFLTETNRLDTIAAAAAHGNMVIVDTKGGNHVSETVVAVKAATARPHAVDKAA